MPFTPSAMRCARCIERIEVGESGLLIPYVGDEAPAHAVMFWRQRVGRQYLLPYHIGCFTSMVIVSGKHVAYDITEP